jgi:proteasome lid subunit RPN8/RPN11
VSGTNSGYRLRIARRDYGVIEGHARSGLPNESCGLIAGRVEGFVKIVERVYPLTNIDSSEEHFTIEPHEQLRAILDMRKSGLVPLGNFHSHPNTPARPSDEDIRLALDPSASYLIISLASETPVMRAFHIESGIAAAEEIEIV